MPADDEHRSAPPSLRQRRRAVATQEIVKAAELHITEHGSAALSLRAVARSLGMSVQALYHYFPDRNALVTVLIAKAYEDLATAVQTAADTTPPDPSVPRFVIAAEGYRQWAVSHPERFQLLYGTPLRSYAAPVGGPTTRAMQQMSAVFQRVLFGDFTPEQLAAADTPTLSPPFRAHLEQLSPDGLAALPPQATALLLSGWGHMHGLVVLEVFGHTSFLGDHQAEIFRDFTPEQLAAADTPTLSPPFRAHLEQLSPDGLAALPPQATALLLSGWGHMHGLVVLEVFGHTSFLGDHQAEIFRLAMRDLLTDIHRRVPAGHGNGTGPG